MGLKLSKSIRFGAVRFNLSSSGIGVSAGIPGLRVGTGPRGAYISGSLGAFRYRKSVGRARPSGKRTTMIRPGQSRHSTPGSIPGAPSQQSQTPTLGRTVFDSTSVLELTDASGESILQTIREQSSRPAQWPAAAVALTMALIWLAWVAPQLPTAVIMLAVVAAVATTLWMRWRDKMRRLTVLFYDLDDESTQRFEALSEAVATAAQASEFTAVTEQVSFADKRYHSGADHGVSTRPARASNGFPAGIVANVTVPMLHAENTTFAFLPDLVLLIQGRDIGAVDYQSLRVQCEALRIIQSTPHAPTDATVVGHNWRYQNKDGSPDRRFNGNEQLPKCEFSELALSTGSGLNVRFMSSRQRGLEALGADILRMTGNGPSRVASAPYDGFQHQPPLLPSAGGAGSAAARTGFIQALAFGLVAVGVLVGLVQGVASLKSGEGAAAASASAAEEAAADDSLAKQKAIADAQPSFDCRKAKSGGERLICSNPELAALDRGLAQHFDVVRDAVPLSERKEFATEARKAWLAREAHCRDVACLSDWYKARAAQLDAWDARLAAAVVDPQVSAASSVDEASRSVPTVVISPGKGIRNGGASGQVETTAPIFELTKSFCQAPQSDAQRIVCSDIDLGGRQLALNRRFDDDRVDLQAKLSPDRYAAFVTESDSAAQYRDEQCHDKECLLGWYRGRGEQLAVWEAAAP